MSTAVGPTSLRHEFEQRLDGARRRIRRARLRARLAVAIDRALVAAACVSAVFCLLRLGYWAAVDAHPGGRAVYVLLLMHVLTVPPAMALIRAIRERTPLRESAERLDLAAADHNRIAIGLALDEDDGRSAFAAAAIRDGIEHLRQLQDREPFTDFRAGGLRRSAIAAAATVVFSLIFLWPGGESGRRSGPAPGPSATALLPTVRPPATQPAERPSAPPRQPVPQREAGGNAAKRGPETQPAAPAAIGSRAERATGRASGRSGAEAAPSMESSGSAGESTETSMSSPPGVRKESKPTRPRRPKEAQVPGARKTEDTEESSAIGQGTSGGGAASAVQNNWSQREQTAEGDRDEDDSDELIDDETDSSKQRGGIQPSLKDRNESPSRELGISGEEGPPGAGRGGPTPPKKSRGTASLVLGVPVPDFVKGRLGPGMTKITHERVEPTPIPGDPTRPAEAAARSLPESPSPRFDVPTAFARLVRDYLVALHSADQRTFSPDRPPTGGAGVPEPSKEPREP